MREAQRAQALKSKEHLRLEAIDKSQRTTKERAALKQEIEDWNELVRFSYLPEGGGAVVAK
jgi:hypothetical protein